MSGSEYANAEAAALANWMLSPEGQAAARAACGFAQRTGLSVTSSEVCAIVLAAHEGEVAAHDKHSENQPERSGDMIMNERLTLAEVWAEISEIQRGRHDDEAAHGREDDLHHKVLRAIADGTAGDPATVAAMASMALTTLDIEFERHCA
jgi:hypothetical protein